MKWESGMDIYTIPNVKYIASGKQRIAQGDQLSALWPHREVGYGRWEGYVRVRGYGNISICIADWLCYTAETNTPL